MVDQAAFQALKGSTSPEKTRQVSFNQRSPGSGAEKQVINAANKGKQLPTYTSYHQVSDEVDSNHSGELRATMQQLDDSSLSVYRQRTHTTDFGHSPIAQTMDLAKAKVYLKKAKLRFKDGAYFDGLSKLEKSIGCVNEVQLSAMLQVTDFKLYSHVLECYLLAANCYLKMEQYDRAVANCNTVIAVETNLEALQTKSYACEQLGQNSIALSCSQLASQISPSDKELQSRIRKLEETMSKSTLDTSQVESQPQQQKEEAFEICVLYKQPKSTSEITLKPNKPTRRWSLRSMLQLIKNALACLQGFVFLKYLPQKYSKLYIATSWLVVLIVGLFYKGVTPRGIVACLQRLAERH